MNHVILPINAEDRKKFPIGTVIKEYFPNAMAAVAYRSWEGNEQHHPDKPLHWDMSKSSDEIDCLSRHAMEEDYDGMVWRALALYEREFKKGWRPKWWKDEWDNGEVSTIEPLSFKEWRAGWITTNGPLIGDVWWYEHKGVRVSEEEILDLYQEHREANDTTRNPGTIEDDLLNEPLSFEEWCKDSGWVYWPQYDTWSNANQQYLQYSDIYVRDLYQEYFQSFNPPSET